MTLKRFPFDGTLGANVTTSSEGLSVVNRDGGVIQYAERGAVFTSRAADAGETWYTIIRGDASAASDLVAFRGSFMLPALPSGTDEVGIFRTRLASGDSWSSTLVVKATGACDLRDSVNAAADTSLGTITAGTWYDFALVAAGGSTSPQEHTAQLFQDSSNTAVSAAVTQQGNLTALQISGFELGICSQLPSTTVYWDNVQINDGGTANIAPWAPINETYIGVGGAWVPSTGYVGIDGAWHAVTEVQAG